ncbi:response regulator [Sporomusa paucivorans]|jgi:CheY-like chemotaxis protein|uniref:response regulator n=1 Tax=Sporomusa TaxID=2375 RepID=UPI003571098B
MARVLVVDDALMMRKTIASFLSKAGHVVVEEAANGEQAVMAYKKHRPDLVTMDITMPDVDGIDALVRIMAFDANAKVVMVSALGQKHKVFDALQNGAKGYILKPFTEDKLLNILNELLGATTGTTGGFRPELVPPVAWDNKQITPQLPFTVETGESGPVITMTEEFKPLDFGELTKVTETLLANHLAEITFDFTYSNALHSKTAASFRQIMERVAAAGSLLRTVCYTQDYALYFRNAEGLKNTGFELIKKRGAL